MDSAEALRRLIGKRVLLRHLVEQDIMEAVILEVSPSGRHLKIRVPPGHTRWVRLPPYVVEEVLE